MEEESKQLPVLPDEIKPMNRQNWYMVGVSLAMAKTMTAPIERVKLVLQTQNDLVRGGKLPYRFHGIGNCVRGLIKEGKFRSLWRGNTANIIRFMATPAIASAFDEYFKSSIPPKEDGWRRWFFGNFFYGGLSGVCTLTIMHHLDTCRANMATDLTFPQKPTRTYPTIFHFYKNAVKTYGIYGLYRGYFISCVEVFLSRASFLALYESFRWLSSYTEIMRSEREIFACSLAASIVSGLLIYPVDTIRRRLMVRTNPLPTRVLIRTIRQQEGRKSFYRGAFTNIFLSISTGTCFFFFELMRNTQLVRD